MARVLVDTNVLFPYSVMDLMLGLTADRCHTAAALAGRASVIVTWNRGDFPAGPLAELGLRVADPDEYLLALLTEVPDEVLDTVVRLAGTRRRPPMTTVDLIDRLAKAGVVEFAGRIRDRLDASAPETIG